MQYRFLLLMVDGASCLGPLLPVPFFYTHNKTPLRLEGSIGPRFPVINNKFLSSQLLLVASKTTQAHPPLGDLGFALRYRLALILRREQAHHYKI